MTTHRATVEMLTSSNAKIIEESSKSISASEKEIYDATENISKPHQEVKEFIYDFRTSSDKNTTNMNKVIEGFRSALKAEKEALSTLCVNIKVGNVELNSTITTKIEKLQDHLEGENKIMDALAEQTQKTGSA